MNPALLFVFGPLLVYCLACAVYTTAVSPTRGLVLVSWAMVLVQAGLILAVLTWPAS